MKHCWLHLLACLGGMDWQVSSGMEGMVWPAFELHDLQLVSSGKRFSKIGHISTFSALACFMVAVEEGPHRK